MANLATEVKLYGRWSFEDVEVKDISLEDYIACKPKYAQFLPHSPRALGPSPAWAMRWYSRRSQVEHGSATKRSCFASPLSKQAKRPPQRWKPRPTFLRRSSFAASMPTT